MLGIVIPAYNRSDCLREALNSLTCQTNKKFFAVVVDDCSTEDIQSVVDEFDNKLHTVYLRQETNQGPGAARQRGLDWVAEHNMDLIMFMDSDDLLFPNAVDRLTREINRGMRDIVSSGIYQEEKLNSGFNLPADNKTWLHGKIYRTKYLINNNIKFPNIRTNEDLAFNLKAILFTKKAGYIKENLYLFREDSRSITRNKEEANYKQIFSSDNILAIYDAVKFFQDKNLSMPNQLKIDIVGLYNAYQIGLYLYGDLDDNTKSTMKYLIKTPEMQEVFNDPKILTYYTGIPKQMASYKGEIFWFKQTFKDWLEEMSK